MSYPKKQGLYDPKNEKENCGIGFVADMKGRGTHEIIRQGIEVLNKLEHRGACGSDSLTGDGARLPNFWFGFSSNMSDGGVINRYLTPSQE